MVISDITGVVGPDTFERPIYAGNAMQTVQSTDAKKVVTVRGASFEATGEQAPAPIETAGAGRRPRRSRPGSRTRSRRPTGRSSTSARIVVSGGRGVGSEENFAHHREARRQARRRGRRLPRGGRLRLRAERLAGRPDRQGGGARALHRRRHLRRDPAPRRHEGLARSSSRSTRTRRRRSSRSPTTASSATSSRSCRSSRRSSAPEPPLSAGALRP